MQLSSVAPHFRCQEPSGFCSGARMVDEAQATSDSEISSERNMGFPHCRNGNSAATTKAPSDEFMFAMFRNCGKATIALSPTRRRGDEIAPKVDERSARLRVRFRFFAGG